MIRRGRNTYLDIVGAPPEGWTLGVVRIRLQNPEEEFPLECWRNAAFAVHEVEIDHDDLSGQPVRLGVLVHHPTGLRIDDFFSIDAAAEAADLIERLADWPAVREVPGAHRSAERLSWNELGLAVRKRLEQRFVRMELPGVELRSAYVERERVGQVAG